MKNESKIKKLYKYKVCISNEFIRTLLLSPDMNMSLYEYRIILFLIALIQAKAEQFDEVFVYKKTLSELFDVKKNGSTYKSIDNAINNLKSKCYYVKSIPVVFLDEDSSIKAKNGKVRLKLNDMLEQYLLNLKGEYISFDFGNIAKFKSKYSFRLYLYLKSLANLGVYQLTISKAYQLFAANKYKTWNSLYYNVLMPAVYDINDKTDIKISFDLKKKIISDDVIVFSIHDNPDPIEGYMWDYDYDDIKFDEDYKDDLREIDIIEYLLEYHEDYIVFDTAKKRYTHPHHDSVSFYGPFYSQFSKNQYGDIVDYLIKMCEMNPVDVYSEIETYLASSKTTKAKKTTIPILEAKEFIPPERCKSNEPVIINYLLKRGIPETITKELIDNELLYADKSRNCVFISNNEISKVCFVRGTALTKFCKTISTGQMEGFWYMQKGDNPDTIYICESPIDAVSLYIINNQSDGIYVALGGLNNRVLQAVINKLNPDRSKTIILAVDADKAGSKFTNNHKEYPYMEWNSDDGKDMNELLVAGNYHIIIKRNKEELSVFADKKAYTYTPYLSSDGFLEPEDEFDDLPF